MPSSHTGLELSLPQLVDQRKGPINCEVTSLSRREFNWSLTVFQAIGNCAWIGKVRVASCELRVTSCELRVASCSCFASCELRVSSEKCELVHLKRELRVP